MVLWTYLQLKTKIQNDLDLTNETMITDPELLGYVNQAIDEAEQLVTTIYEDYFLQNSNLALVSGQQDYDFPTNIYAHKVRKMLYDNGSNKYEIKRLKDLLLIPDIQTDEPYRFLPYMNSSGAFKLRIYPVPAETSSTNVTIWYLGSANHMVADADLMNIPEAAQYVIAKTKFECAKKEGHPMQMSLAEDVASQKDLLVSTLAAMIPDENNQIQLDYSYYTDMN